MGTILYISDLQSPTAQLYRSLKHGLVSKFTDQNTKKCNHIQDENYLCDKSNSPHFRGIQRLLAKLSDYFPYKFEHSLAKENECF